MNRLRRIGRYLIVLFVCLYPLQVQGASKQNPAAGGAFWEGRAIGPEEIKDLLGAQIQKMIGDQKKRIEIKDVRGYEKIVLPPEPLSFEILLPEQAYRGGSISGVIVVRMNGQEIRRASLTARVDIFADVISARHHLRKHYVIKEDDVQRVNKNIALLPQDLVTEMKEVVGKRTTLSVNGHEVLRMGMVEIPPLVNKGDRVTLLVENEQFRITTMGEVQEVGRKGDRIKLVNLSSKREVLGRVLDANTVQIEF